MAGSDLPERGKLRTSKALSPKTKEEAITLMFKGFGEFVEQTRVAMYLEILGDYLTDEVWDAIKVWMRQPHDRAAKTGELRDLMNTARDRQEKLADAKRRDSLAAAIPTDSSHIDAYYDELLREYPDNQFLRERVEERAKLRSLGKLMDGAAEVRAIIAAFERRREVSDAD